MDLLKNYLDNWSGIEKDELLFHGSPFDFDILNSNITPTLYFGFNPLLSLAILTEKIKNDEIGYIYCLKLKNDIKISPHSFSLVSPIFLSEPQNVSDGINKTDIYGTRKEAENWDTSKLIFPMDSLCSLEQEVELPIEYLKDAILIDKRRININELRNIIKEYGSENKVKENMEQIINLITDFKYNTSL